MTYPAAPAIPAPTEPVTIEQYPGLPERLRLRVRAALANSGQWISRNQVCTVGGIRIAGGWFYVGTPSDLRKQPDPGLIDPTLQVDHAGEDSCRPLPHRTTYAEMAPTSRYDYLSWLASARVDPSLPVAYLFLYFYGLERRIVIEACRNESAQAELPEIAAELVRLIEIYGVHDEFRKYAEVLVAWTHLRSRVPFDLGTASMALPNCSSSRPLIRALLGRFARDQIPLPPYVALAWVRACSRCAQQQLGSGPAEHFDVLFLARYSQRFCRGIVPRRTDSVLLRTSYAPASNAIRNDLSLTLDQVVPDVFRSSAALEPLERLAGTVCGELKEYEKYVRRRREADAAAGAVFRLPYVLWPAPQKSAVDRLLSRIEGEPSGAAKLSRAELTEIFPDCATRSDFVALARSLATCNLGFEPDVLAGVRLPAKSPVVVFACADVDAADRTSLEYRAAQMTLTIAARAGLLRSSTETVRVEIQSWDDLNEMQRSRLVALALLLSDRPLTSSKRACLEAAKLPYDARLTLAKRVLQLRGVSETGDSYADAVLSKAMKLLGVGPEEDDCTPHVVAARRAGISLDLSRIDALRQETDGLAQRLGRVFADRELDSSDELSGKSPSAAVAKRSFGAIHGLDDRHFDFIRAAVLRREWTALELQELAQTFGLFLAGAITHINEASLDAVGESLLDGSDPISINQDTLKELTS